jgi:hypothetical protein
VWDFVDSDFVSWAQTIGSPEGAGSQQTQKIRRNTNSMCRERKYLALTSVAFRKARVLKTCGRNVRLRAVLEENLKKKNATKKPQLAISEFEEENYIATCMVVSISSPEAHKPFRARCASPAPLPCHLPRAFRCLWWGLRACGSVRSSLVVLVNIASSTGSPRSVPMHACHGTRVWPASFGHPIFTLSPCALKRMDLLGAFSGWLALGLRPQNT